MLNDDANLANAASHIDVATTAAATGFYVDNAVTLGGETNWSFFVHFSPPPTILRPP